MLFNMVELFIPLMLAALGGLYSEKAGILNISLEGLILSSAFAAFATAELTGSLLVALLAALITALLLSHLFVLGTLILKGNIYVIGLAVNLAAYPLTSSLSRLFFHQGGALRAENFRPPRRWGYLLQQEHPLSGILLGHNWFFLIAILSILFTLLWFRNSKWGLETELCGTSPVRLSQKGISPLKVQYRAIMMSGIFCGFAGAALSLPLGSYVPSMSAGKGWIALVIIYLGNSRVYSMVLAALLFSLLESLSIQAQGLWDISASIILSLPYFLTLLLLAVANGLKKRKNRTTGLNNAEG